MPPKKKRNRGQQTIRDMGMYLKLPKPLAVVGLNLTLKGSYFNWDAKVLAEKFKDVDYACVIASFSNVHKWTALTKQPPSAAFELQDPAKQPDGSHSSLRVQYPLPFLKQWHKSQPENGSDSGHDEDPNGLHGPGHLDGTNS